MPTTNEPTDDPPTGSRRGAVATPSDEAVSAFHELVRLVSAHADSELEVNRQGHADTRAAVMASATMQTAAVDRQTRVLGGLGAAFGAVLVFMIAGFMYLAGVDLDAASRATREVVTAVEESETPE
jgi:hypothetical protein